MKKIVTVIMLLLLATAMTACGVNSQKAAPESTAQPVAETTQAEITEDTTQAETEIEEAETRNETIEDAGSYETVNAYQPQWRLCPACSGSRGHYETSFDGFGNPIQQWVPCNNCSGSGYVYY